jgi:AcrR family transcriptional regulator
MCSDTALILCYCNDMQPPVKPSGDEPFPRRQRRARATRVRILDVARALFLEQGYVGTTINAIAERADVAPETVYAAFGSKRALLSQLVDLSIAGAVAASPVLEQGWVRELREEPDVRHRIRMLAHQGRLILDRRAALDEVMRGAASADPEIAALHERGKAERFAGQRELLRLAVGETPVAEGIDFATAVDIVYVLGSPETYRLLVIDRGWSGDQFEAWYGEMLERLVGLPASSR